LEWSESDECRYILTVPRRRLLPANPKNFNEVALAISMTPAKKAIFRLFSVESLGQECTATRVGASANLPRTFRLEKIRANAG
jgi:hypothetical protein